MATMVMKSGEIPINNKLLFEKIFWPGGIPGRWHFSNPNDQDMCDSDGMQSSISTGPTTLPSMKGKPGDAISDLFIEPEKDNVRSTIGSGSSGSSGPDILTGLVVNVIWWIITSAFGASGRSGNDNSGDDNSGDDNSGGSSGGEETADPEPVPEPVPDPEPVPAEEN